jgi:hypothetical protein
VEGAGTMGPLHAKGHSTDSVARQHMRPCPSTRSVLAPHFSDSRIRHTKHARTHTCVACRVMSLPPVTTHTLTPMLAPRAENWSPICWASSRPAVNTTANTPKGSRDRSCRMGTAKAAVCGGVGRARRRGGGGIALSCGPGTATPLHRITHTHTHTHTRTHTHTHTRTRTRTHARTHAHAHAHPHAHTHMHTHTLPVPVCEQATTSRSFKMAGTTARWTAVGRVMPSAVHVAASHGCTPRSPQGFRVEWAAAAAAAVAAEVEAGEAAAAASPPSPARARLDTGSSTSPVLWLGAGAGEGAGRALVALPPPLEKSLNPED